MSNLFNPPKFVDLELVGLDGNAFNLLGAFQRAAKREGWSDGDINMVLNEARSSGYNHLIETLANHCDPIEGNYWQDDEEDDYWSDEE